MTEPTREQDEAELQLSTILIDVVESFVLSNTALNAEAISCQLCVAEQVFGTLAVKYALHNRDRCDSDEDFLSRATQVYNATLRDTLAHAKTLDNASSAPTPTHAGTRTSQ